MKGDGNPPPPQSLARYYRYRVKTYLPELADFGFAGRRDELAEGHGLHQARLAHEGLIQQVAHDLEQDAGALGVDVGLMRPGVAVAAEQHRAQRRERLVIEFGQGADFLQGAKQLALAAYGRLP